MNVRISVIIPAFNAAVLLPRAVGSIQMQDWDDVEIIIVDDGSTDSTAEVCERLALSDERIRVVRKENGGVSSARNAGLDAASGEFVMFMDADDAIREDAFDRMYRPDADLVLGGFEKVVGISVADSYVPKSSRLYAGNDNLCSFIDKVISPKNCYLLNSACFKLFRRSVIKKNALRFAEGLSYAEDKLFVMSFLCNVEKVWTVPYVVYSYFIQPVSLSSDMSSDTHIRQVLMLLERYRPLVCELNRIYGRSLRIRRLYHDDLIGRYVCRILTVFCRRKSEMMSEDTLALLYDLMDGDEHLGIFSIRFGQVLNILLYKIRNVRFSAKVYKFCGALGSSVFKAGKKK